MTCPSCQQPIHLRPEDTTCPKCGAKVRESLDEMNVRIAAEQDVHTIGRARRWLLISAVIILVQGLADMAVALGVLARMGTLGIVVLWAPVVLGLVFLGLWWYASKNPLVATLVALVLFGTLIVVDGIVVPGSLLSPIAMLLRVLLIVSLVTGVRAARRQRQGTR
jgi:hypothetical protein